MSHDILYAESVFGLCAEHTLDEGFGLTTHILPLRVGKTVLASPDSLLHARGNGMSMVAVERREATQSEKFNCWVRDFYIFKIHQN